MMTATPSAPAASRLTSASASGLTINAYRGNGSVLIAYSLDSGQLTNLAGFSIQRTAPDGTSAFLNNRLSFAAQLTSATTVEQRTLTPSDQAPFQYFRWVDFPTDILPGTYTYTVMARYFGPNNTLTDGARANVAVDLTTPLFGNFQVGFTRGFLSSQAYVNRFGNAPLRPAGPKTISYDTTPFAAQYAWLGFEARPLMMNLLAETVNDPTLTLDALVYDLDEPDIIRALTQLGPRLRILMDDAPLHTGATATEPIARQQFIQSAGAANVRTGHFGRFAHSKVLIQKRNGQPVKVLTGSTNFSVRGLYVQANNVLVFTDSGVAALYERMFIASFNGSTAQQFSADPISQQRFPINVAGCPDCDVAFSPHQDPLVSLKPVADAMNGATSSVLFAIMDLGGTGPVMDAVQALPDRNVFSYGVTQSETATEVGVWKPGAGHAELVPFSFLKQNVPAPFRAEWDGGFGQVIHHKFVVVDFNGPDPVVFTGSSNLAQGGEALNGDNLLAIRDRGTATLYAVEAVRLLDHFRFRAVLQQATSASPLQLQGPGAAVPWYTPYYQTGNIKAADRLLFAGSST